MATYVSPAHQATLNEMDRIEAAAAGEAWVLDILNLGSSRKLKDVKKGYLKQAQRVHPHRGGNFSAERAESAFGIVARAMEQVKRAAEYDAFVKAGRAWPSFPDAEYTVPGTLWFSRGDLDEETELLQAQQDAEEAEEAERDSANAAAAAGGAADEGAGEDAGSDDDDEDEDSGSTTPGGGLAALFIAAAFVPIPEVVDEQYPDFEGVSHSPEHKAHIVASKAFYRKQQQRRASRKAKVMAINRLAAAKFDSLSWRPLPIAEVKPAEIGLVFQQRWEAEQHARSWAASRGVHGGVKIVMNHESLLASCRTCSSFRMGYNYQPSSGQWILKKLVDHAAGCFGAPTPADGATAGEAASACKSAFTAKQVARAVLNSPLADHDMNLAKVRSASSSCFLRTPSARFLGSVKKAAYTSMAVDRAVDMAALPGYADALCACGHSVTLPPSRPCCLLFRSPSR